MKETVKKILQFAVTFVLVAIIICAACVVMGAMEDPEVGFLDWVTAACYAALVVVPCGWLLTIVCPDEDEEEEGKRHE